MNKNIENSNDFTHEKIQAPKGNFFVLFQEPYIKKYI